jgi:hypothetical protein
MKPQSQQLSVLAAVNHLTVASAKPPLSGQITIHSVAFQGRRGVIAPSAIVWYPGDYYQALSTPGFWGEASLWGFSR